MAKVCQFFAFKGLKTLIVLDDCAASKDVKGRTGELVKLGFSARHAGISVWVLTQQLSSITKPFREKVAAIVLFYTPSAKTTKAIFEEYAGELSHDELKQNQKGGTKRATDPIWSLKVYQVVENKTKPNQPVVYYLSDRPKRGFVREELLVVPPNTQLPPA